MSLHDTINFKATALDEDTLRRQAPSIFASGPMATVSNRYTFVPPSRIVTGLPSHPNRPTQSVSSAARQAARSTH